MTRYLDAFCTPGDRINRRVTSFGVYDCNGALVPDTSIKTTVWVTRPAKRVSRLQDSSRLFGPSFFAGSVDKQFGFILLNSLGRLPAIDDLPAHTTLVFAAKGAARAVSFNVLPAILRSLGLTNPLLVTETPLAFEELHTGPELFGEALGGKGKPAFYDWIDSRWSRKAKADPNVKLYVTRSGLGPNAGRYACEDHLERLLAQEGYRAFSPEAHSISEQVETFQRAGKLIFAEGSALHLFALIRQPDQISAVIQRRESLPDVMIAQMEDRSGPPTVAINAVSEVWWPPHRGDHLGRSVLNFPMLRDRLVDLGLIHGKGWAAPSDAELRASLRDGLKEDEDVMTADGRAAWLKQKRAKTE